MVSRMLKNEGPRALYSGFFANLARILPNYAIIFILYENLCYRLEVPTNE